MRSEVMLKDVVCDLILLHRTAFDASLMGNTPLAISLHYSVCFCTNDLMSICLLH